MSSRRMTPGAVYYVPNFPYEDGTPGDERPGLFLGYKTIDGKNLMLFLKVTTHPHITREPINTQLLHGPGLKNIPSYVQCDWQFPAPDNTKIGRYRGQVNPSDLIRILTKYRSYHM
ncbi:MAG: hypothetical protein AB2392_20800 [Neobacillus sp.]